MKTSISLLSLMTLLMVSGVAFAGTVVYDGPGDSPALAGTADYTVAAVTGGYTITKGATAGAGAVLLFSTANSGGVNSVNTQDWIANIVLGAANVFPATTQGMSIQPRFIAGGALTEFRLHRIIIDEDPAGGTFYACVASAISGAPDASASLGTRVTVASRANLAFRIVYNATARTVTYSVSTTGLAGPFTTMLASDDITTISYQLGGVPPTYSYSAAVLDQNMGVYLIMDPGAGQTLTLDRFDMTGTDVGLPPPPVPQLTPSASAPTLGMWGVVALGICLLAIAFTAMARRQSRV